VKWWKAAFGLERDGAILEKKEIVGSGALGAWASGGVSRQDGDNFRTNRVTLAEFQDRYSTSSPIGLSATWACVRLLSSTIASLPLMVYRTVSGVRQPARGHPLYYVLHDSPNYDQTAFHFWEISAAAIELQGNAYAQIERRADGSIYSLAPMRPDLVTVRRGNNGMLEYRYNGGEVLPVEQVLHIRGALGDAEGGVSTLTANAGVFANAMTADSAARNTFSNGLRPSGVLSTDPSVSLTKEQRAEFNGYLQENFTGSLNSGRPMLLDRGMKWTQLNITPHDAEMLETRKFSGEEICRIFGVPPAMVGYGDKSSNWGTGKEVDVLGFQKFSLGPRLERIEQSLMKQLLTPADRAQGITIEFNLEGLLRGDSMARSQVHASALMHGWRTINEVRAIENLPPIEGGDVAPMQMQNVPITEAGNEPPGGEE
jgi:HK97 family phage portal protein